MAIVTKLVQDGFEGNDTNGGAFAGTFGIDRLGPREGTLLSVAYRLVLDHEITGEGYAPPFVPFVNVTSFFSLDLDVGDDDGVGLDAELKLSEGRAYPNAAPDPTVVSFASSRDSGPIAVPEVGRFVGGGELVVDWAA